MKHLLLSGKHLYLILFSGTAVIILAMLLVERNIELSMTDSSLKTRQVGTITNASSNNLNQLLLKSGELTIEEKKSLINLYLKGDGSAGETVSYALIKQKRDEVYGAILKRQLTKTEPEQSSDFSIRPVPK